ncbi:hypothetical protein [Sporosarcina highlanderae]|uniref:Uncharacterized protein n=1 Tax=Sporosarcina highlanderae TaxID=3035916 RepID=A0ABT8JL72_9BACL|nr:hypothetical protein [Sporosarcina highlanderae]MDN4605903.1 hypothetical protein [Sporosarcina highlanderae]
MSKDIQNKEGVYLSISLKLVESKEYEHDGYGAGSGSIIKEEYSCPCGKGKVFYEKDDIPGYRDKSIYSNCDTCNEKYDFGRGTAVKNNV